MNKWEIADRISDRIINLLNDEIKRPNCAPLQMFAGQMMAMLSMLRTAPEEMPSELKLVQNAIEVCLASMVRKEPKN